MKNLKLPLKQKVVMNYKKLASFLIMLIFWLNIHCQLKERQEIFGDFAITASFKLKYNATSDTIKLFEIVYDDNGAPAYAFCVRPYSKDSEVLIPMLNFYHKDLKPLNVNSFWALQGIKKGIYNEYLNSSKDNLIKRQRWLDMTNKATDEFSNNLNNPIITAYVNGILSNITGKYKSVISSVKIRAVILNSNVPNASAAPNGVIFINTGLLALLNTEYELIAVLAHEVAHIVLEHYLNRKDYVSDNNYLIVSEALKRELYLEGRNIKSLTYEEYFKLWYKISNNLSKGRSRELEYEADKLAKEYLDFIGIDAKHWFNALLLMEKYEQTTTNYYNRLDADYTNTHPTIQQRLFRLGYKDTVYLSDLDSNYVKWTLPVIRKCGINAFLNTSIDLSISEPKEIAIDYLRKCYTYSKNITDLCVLTETLIKTNGNKKEVSDLILKLELYSVQSALRNRTLALGNVFLGDNQKAINNLKKYQIDLNSTLTIDLLNYPYFNGLENEKKWVNENLGIFGK